MDQKNKNEYLIIDGSYFIFYRVTALLIWWKNAHKDTPIDKPFENELFKKKYLETVESKIKELVKKNKLIDPTIIVGKDCKRNDIWRNNYIEKYKGTRVDCKDTVGPFFKMTYEEKLFEKSGVNLVLYHPKLEADDCIALYTKHLIEKDPNVKIIIITSDKDYLQLKNKNVTLLDLKFKDITEKNSFKNAEKDLFCKIILGDKSDNIPGIFKKCGIKTAEKYFDDKKLFNEQLEKEQASERFDLNSLLIDFNNIPENYRKDFNENLKLCSS
jgi:5'-3' exonuclease